MTDKRINNIIDLVVKLIKNAKLYKSNSILAWRFGRREAKQEHIAGQSQIYLLDCAIAVYAAVK